MKPLERTNSVICMSRTSSLGCSLLFASSLCAAAAFNGGSYNVCTNSYTGIGDITIAETGAATDFGTVGTATTNNLLFIQAPDGFAFSPATGSVNSFFGNITSISILFVNASTIAIRYNVDDNTIARNDVITIRGIRVKAPSISSSTGLATLGAGSTPINGLSTGATAFMVRSALTSMTFADISKTTSDPNFFLAGFYTLAIGVSLTSTSYSGPGVSGSNFSPATAGAGVHTLAFNVNTNSPTCTFTVNSTADVNLPPVLDADSDGATDAVETALGTDPNTSTDWANLDLDSDQDGLSDDLETALGTNIHSNDTDNDGLTDALELIQYITLPTSTDTDGDGIPDNIDAEPGIDSCTLPLNGSYKGVIIDESNN